jgi:hypothetical protein
MLLYLKGQLSSAALGALFLSWALFGLPACVFTADATLAFVAYVLATFRLSWIGFSGFHAAALGLFGMHALAPFAERVEGHMFALIAIPFLVMRLLFGLSLAMPSPSRKGAGGADPGGTDA